MYHSYLRAALYVLLFVLLYVAVFWFVFRLKKVQREMKDEDYIDLLRSIKIDSSQCMPSVFDLKIIPASLKMIYTYFLRGTIYINGASTLYDKENNLAGAAYVRIKIDARFPESFTRQNGFMFYRDKEHEMTVKIAQGVGQIFINGSEIGAIDIPNKKLEDKSNGESYDLGFSLPVMSLPFTNASLRIEKDKKIQTEVLMTHKDLSSIRVGMSTLLNTKALGSLVGVLGSAGLKGVINNVLIDKEIAKKTQLVMLTKNHAPSVSNAVAACSIYFANLCVMLYD